MALYEDCITLPASLFPKDCSFLGLDKGCSLTKACIGRRDGDAVNFACRTYQNSDLGSAVEWLATDGGIQGSTEIKITGVGGDILRPSISERLKCRVTFVDEFRAQKKGAGLLLLHGSESQIFFPDPTPLFESKMSAAESATWSEFADKAVISKDLFPTLFFYIGSATGITWIADGGQSEAVDGGTFLGGKSFLGLCNLVLDTVDFKEIDELAKKGDRAKFDLMGSDVFGECNDSSYSAFPKDMSIFHLGKLADGLITNERLSREDKAAAVVGIFGEIFRGLIQAYSAGQAGNRIVIGGNLIRSEYFRADCFSRHHATALFHGGKTLKFLRTGHTAAIGAILVEEAVKKG